MDLMQRRRQLMGMQKKGEILPPAGYQFIDYAENKGNSYVTLPYGFDDTDIVEIKGSMLNGFGDKYMVAPGVWNDNNNRFAMLGGISSNFVFSFGKQGTPNNRLQPAVPSDVNVHICKYKNKQFIMLDNGSIADMSNVEFGGTTQQLRLFYGYSGSTKGKIYYFKQSKMNGQNLNVLPIQNTSTGTVEMYDTVSQTILPRYNNLSAPQ